MEKIILRMNGVSHEEGLLAAIAVVRQGLISTCRYGKQYCYHTVLGEGPPFSPSDKISVSVTKNENNTQTFYVNKDF